MEVKISKFIIEPLHVSYLVEKISSEIDLQNAFEIRRRVFVHEQHIDPELEYDQYESSSIHFIAKNTSHWVGTARYRITAEGIKLERFAILPECRGLGLGTQLCRAILAEAVEKGGLIYLHAQHQVIDFYLHQGFLADGPEFLEAGLVHQRMIFSGPGVR